MQSNKKVPGPLPYLWIPITAEPVYNTRGTETECRKQSCCASFQSFIFITFEKIVEEFLCKFCNPVVQIVLFQSMSVCPFYFCSIYSSDEDDEDMEMCDHDYDGLLPKSGKRHLGKTRWTREEVINHIIKT